MVALVLTAFVSACTAERSASTTTAAPTTTGSTAPLPATTTTKPPVFGIVITAPADCEDCEQLATAVADLVQGAVPIHVNAGGSRPSVQIVAESGDVLAEWRGDEPTVPPAQRATTGNAEAIFDAACTHFADECAFIPRTAQATLVWGEWERRYYFAGERPAPLGDLGPSLLGADCAGGQRTESQFTATAHSRIISGVLLDRGELKLLWDPDLSAGRSAARTVWYADLYLGDSAGNPIIFRALGPRDRVQLRTHDPGGLSVPDNQRFYPVDLLPRPFDSLCVVALRAETDFRTPTSGLFVGRGWEQQSGDFFSTLVVGRQYAVDLLSVPGWTRPQCEARPNAVVGCDGLWWSNGLYFPEGVQYLSDPGTGTWTDPDDLRLRVSEPPQSSLDVVFLDSPYSADQLAVPTFTAEPLAWWLP